MDTSTLSYYNLGSIIILRKENRLLHTENKGIPPNTLRVKFKRLLNCPQEKYFITYTMEINGIMVSQQTDICGAGCVFNYERDVPLGNDRKSFATSHVMEVRIMEKGFFHDKQVGQGSLKLNEFDYTNIIEGSQDVSMKIKGMTLEYGLYLREPMSKGRNKFEVIKINKMFNLE